MKTICPRCGQEATVTYSRRGTERIHTHKRADGTRCIPRAQNIAPELQYTIDEDGLGAQRGQRPGRMMTKSDAMWIGYWAMRTDIETELVFWLRSLARGTPDTYWEGHIIERAEAAMVFYGEYRRLNRPKRQRRKKAA